MGEELTPGTFYMKGADGEYIEFHGLKSVECLEEQVEEFTARIKDLSISLRDLFETFSVTIHQTFNATQLYILLGYPNKNHIRMALYSKKYRVRKKYRNRINKYIKEVSENDA